MARTNLPLTTLVPNSGIAVPAGTTIDQSNGMNIQIPANTIPAAPDTDNLVLVVANSVAAPKTVIVRAGAGGGVTPGAAFRAGLGDLTVTVAASSSAYVGPLESARFLQLDGSLNVDFGASAAGTIIALIMPERF